RRRDRAHRDLRRSRDHARTEVVGLASARRRPRRGEADRRRVGKSYRLPNGDQLVDVIARAPSVSPASSTSIPIHYVGVRGTKASGDKIISVSSSNSVMYTLCGLGSGCSIASGKATVARGTLVRREILELALYTFK